MNKPALCQECSGSEWGNRWPRLSLIPHLRQASGHEVGQLVVFWGISSQDTLLVSKNKPQILRKSLHMCICAVRGFSCSDETNCLTFLGKKGLFAFLLRGRCENEHQSRV